MPTVPEPQPKVDTREIFSDHLIWIQLKFTLVTYNCSVCLSSPGLNIHTCWHICIYTWIFFSFINPLTIIIALCGCLRQQLGGLAWSRRDCWLLREVKLSSGCVGRQVGVPQPITSCKINWQLMGCENVYLACNKRGLYANKCSSITAEMRINALKGSLKAHINS